MEDYKMTQCLERLSLEEESNLVKKIPEGTLVILPDGIKGITYYKGLVKLHLSYPAQNKEVVKRWIDTENAVAILFKNFRYRPHGYDYNPICLEEEELREYTKI